jgi:hypothetical protein
MDCKDEDAFREGMRGVGEDAEYLSTRGISILSSRGNLLKSDIWELLTFMPTILADLLMLGRGKVKVGGESKICFGGITA